jgi:TrmH family RNA methyltransferase
MKAYLEFDKPASALQRYEVTRLHLRAELGITPDQELMTLAKEIYDNHKASEAPQFNLLPDEPEPTRTKENQMNEITSRQNPKIKQIRGLSQRKQRDAQKLFVVEGIRHVGEAIESGAEVEYLMVAPDQLSSDYAQSLVEKAQDKGIEVISTTPDIFSSLAEKEHPQGLLAVVRQNLTPLDSLSPANFPWGAAVVAPQDPGNLGTILRTLDAVGASGLLVLEGGVDVFHPGAVRASMGALFTKAVVKASFGEFSAWAQGHGYKIYGSSAHADTPYNQVTYESPAILLLGSEREGLTPEQAGVCDQLLQIPMAGSATSLNLSIAAGVLLYEMREQLG